MASRAATSDEEWIASQAGSDQEWAAQMAKSFGLKFEL
jgi:hypothetical protein